MTITTSYFARSKNLKGTKISVARFNHNRIRSSIDEILNSFAPSQQLLRAYKSGKMNWWQYKRDYISEQRKHYIRNPEDFESLLERAEKENIILLCYERFEGINTKCHRLILYDILKKIAYKNRYNIGFIEETFYKIER